MALHLITSSPHGSSCLSDCLNVLGTHDPVVLIGDGVYALPKLSLENKIYCIAEDCVARGIEANRAHAIDHEGLVRLTEQFYPVVTWS